MSVLERCPFYRESNKGSKERQGPTLGVRFTEVSVKRESTVSLIISFTISSFFVYFCKDYSRVPSLVDREESSGRSS